MKRSITNKLGAESAGLIHPKDVKFNSGESPSEPTVAIIGGGASGVLAAVRLLESPEARAGKFRVRLIERRSSTGRGVAYGTESPFHLLNVRQSQMSAYPENSEHFARWVARTNSGEMKNAFQPRHRYADYLSFLLAEAARAAPGFSSMIGEVRDFARREDGRTEIHLSGGAIFVCDRLILATGHRSPGTPEGLREVSQSARFIADPWEPGKTAAIGKNERVLIVGSGLTTVDLVMSRFRAGHLAPIEVLSRHGLAPLGHSAVEAELPRGFTLPEGTAREIFRGLRSAAAAAKDAWPAVIDRFRAEVYRVWQSWPESERRRFLRHARAYWEIHRHRVAPEVHREWDLYLRGGKTRITAGRILSATEAGDGFHVKIAERGGVVREKIYDRIVNCTGAAPDLSVLDGHGYLTDPLRIGIPTDSAGRPFQANGEIDPRVFIFGPALRTRFWEMTAIPDLRGQAKVLAEAVIASLTSSP